MAPESQSTESLFDILYTDRERLTLYLSQIDPNGVLTGFKTSSVDGSSISSDVKGNIGVAGFAYNGKTNNQDSLERSYDPAAALPIQVLNGLDEKNFIHRDINKTPIGSLILNSGYLSLFDTSFALTLWPFLQKKIDFRAMAQSANNGSNGHGKKITVEDITEIVKAIIEKIPQPIHMILSNEHKIWGTLSDSGFMSPPNDLFLKHKNIIPGKWYVLGILDTLNERSEFDASGLQTFGGQLLRGVQDLFGHMISMFGRPDDAYGITPLIIFREVARCSD